ncbi:hypothetical protein D4R51_04440 [bacterium]|nr:MAG: hypothetical protein D4R51_04440 [bacterium]
MRVVKIIFWVLVAMVIIIALVSVLRSPETGNTIGTNINSSASSSQAWDDVSNWWDFYGTQNVLVKGTSIQGYASSSVGDISLDCATTRSGNICGSSNYGVCNGPGPHNTDGTCPNGNATGILTGYGWNDTIGWISFNCDQSSQGGTNDCASSDYKVSVDQNTGDFSGYAWNDTDGWISFNCANNSSCGTIAYKVNTLWRATSTVGYLTSSVFDTQVVSGVTLSSITWEGSSPAGTCTNFQIAASNNSGGSWNYMGPSGDNASYYGATCAQSINGGLGCAPLDTPICVNSSQFNNYRYYRYKAQLQSNLVQTQTPRVDDVVLNFSQ